jgi:hypothetical protein
VPARAGDKGFKNAYRTYSTALARAGQEEKVFWKTADKRLREAYDLFGKQWQEWYGMPDAPPDIFYDLTGYQRLYAEYERISRCQGDAAYAFAVADGPKTAKFLCGKLLGVNDKIVRVEKTLRKARAVLDSYHYDQEPVIRRLGLAVHRDGLIRALGRLRDDAAVVYVTQKGWKDACSADRRSRGVMNRVSILDAMALVPGDRSWALLKTSLAEKELSVRIAALEGMGCLSAGREEKLTAVCLQSLTDEKAFPMQLAALTQLEALSPLAAVGAMIGLLEREVEAQDGGIICGHLLRILKKLTGKDYGLNWENWKGWYGRHAKAFEDGTYKPETAGNAEPGKKKKMKSVSFYNIPTYSKGILILIDASDTLIIPADIDVAKKHSIFYWLESSRKKLEKYKSQIDVLKEEARKAIEAMDHHTVFNVVLLYRDNRKEACWPKMTIATDANKQKALKMITEVRAGGWAPQYAGLLEAYGIAGLDPYAADFPDPKADTVYLLTDGGICGGRYMTPKALVQAVARLNRFRKVTINTVQIADLGPDAVVFLKGLAKATGGSYVWRKK